MGHVNYKGLFIYKNNSSSTVSLSMVVYYSVVPLNYAVVPPVHFRIVKLNHSTTIEVRVRFDS